MGHVRVAKHRGPRLHVEAGLASGGSVELETGQAHYVRRSSGPGSTGSSRRRPSLAPRRCCRCGQCEPSRSVLTSNGCARMPSRRPNRASVFRCLNCTPPKRSIECLPLGRPSGLLWCVTRVVRANRSVKSRGGSRRGRWRFLSGRKAGSTRRSLTLGANSLLLVASGSARGCCVRRRPRLRLWQSSRRSPVIGAALVPVDRPCRYRWEFRRG